MCFNPSVSYADKDKIGSSIDEHIQAPRLLYISILFCLSPTWPYATSSLFPKADWLLMGLRNDEVLIS